MTGRAAATRYARALFDVALKERATSTRCSSELQRLRARSSPSHEALQRAL